MITDFLLKLQINQIIVNRTFKRKKYHETVQFTIFESFKTQIMKKANRVLSIDIMRGLTLF